MDYRVHRQVEKKLYEYGDLLIRWGYFILSDGVVVKWNAARTEKEMMRAKRLAIKVGLKTVAYREGNLYLYNQYNYLNRKNVLFYIVYPLIGLIGGIIWLSLN